MHIVNKNLLIKAYYTRKYCLTFERGNFRTNKHKCSWVYTTYVYTYTYTDKCRHSYRCIYVCVCVRVCIYVLYTHMYFLVLSYGELRNNNNLRDPPSTQILVSKYHSLLKTKKKEGRGGLLAK